MSNVIQVIEGYTEENIVKGILCSCCGVGNTLSELPTLCRCGKGNMEPHTFDFSRWVKGYIIVKCHCGKKVECHNFTNTCSCGADYNFSGTLLAPRSQWGEETGEHWAECY